MEAIILVLYFLHGEQMIDVNVTKDGDMAHFDTMRGCEFAGETYLALYGNKTTEQGVLKGYMCGKFRFVEHDV